MFAVEWTTANTVNIFNLKNFALHCQYTIKLCDWICKKESYTHNFKYLEIYFWNIQFNISREWLELSACVSSQIYSYSRQFTVSVVHWIASWIAQHLEFFTDVANTTSNLIGWEGGQGAIKWRAKVTSSLKTAKWLPLLLFSPPHVTQSS